MHDELMRGVAADVADGTEGPGLTDAQAAALDGLSGPVPPPPPPPPPAPARGTAFADELIDRPAISAPPPPAEIPALPPDGSVPDPTDPVDWGERPVSDLQMPEHPALTLLHNPGRMKWRAITADRKRRGGKAGRAFQTPRELELAYADYCAMLSASPKWVTEIKTEDSKRTPRYMPATVTGLCHFVGVSTQCWQEWKTPGHRNFRSDLADAMLAIEEACRDSQVAQAVSSTGDAPTLARLAGLAEKRELEVTADAGIGVVAIDAALDILGITQEQVDAEVAKVDSAAHAIGEAK